MYDSDKKYLSRFALDPSIEYGCEDLNGADFPYPCDEEADLFDDENILDLEDSILDDDVLAED